MILRALTESPDLRLRVLVGEDALDRQVGGVFTTDLLDPRRYLSGGEIVLTGLMWRRGPADSEAFVSTVVAAGAVALAAGDAALGSVPDDLVLACHRHRLPLFEVPVDVSFAAITEQVLTARLRSATGPNPAVARLRLLAGGPPGTARPGSGSGGDHRAGRVRRGQPRVWYRRTGDLRGRAALVRGATAGGRAASGGAGYGVAERGRTARDGLGGR